MSKCPKYPEQGVIEAHFGMRLRWFSNWWNARDPAASSAGRGAHRVVLVYHFVGRCPKPLAYACRWGELPLRRCDAGHARFAYDQWRHDYRLAAQQYPAVLRR